MSEKTEKKKAKNIVNALLYSIESLTAILFTVVSVALVARHFGPEVFSRYSVVQSVSTVLMVFVTLGLDQFIVRDLVRKLDDAEYVTTVLVGSLIGWVVYVILMVGYYVLYKDFSKDFFLIANVAVMILFWKAIIIRNYIQAKNQPRSIATASVISRLVSVVYLVAGTLMNFSFDVMMMYLPIQAIILTIGMMWGHPDFLKLVHVRLFNWSRLISILREASPVFISTFLFFFYSQSDVLIMSSLLDEKSVGTYSAAIRIIPQMTFVGQVLVATFYTGMDKRYLSDRLAFEHHMRLVLAIHFGVGLILAGAVCVTSPYIIHLLYGERYAQSATILAISCWSWVFLLPAALYSRLLIMLGYVKYELIKMVIVAPLILGLNYWAISQYGMQGSAIVCVFSYFLVDFLIYFMFRKTRRLATIGLQAMGDLVLRPRETIRASILLLNERH